MNPPTCAKCGKPLKETGRKTGHRGATWITFICATCPVIRVGDKEDMR